MEKMGDEEGCAEGLEWRKQHVWQVARPQQHLKEVDPALSC